jgi:sugar lactone lactonase YvrE
VERVASVKIHLDTDLGGNTDDLCALMKKIPTLLVVACAVLGLYAPGAQAQPWRGMPAAHTRFVAPAILAAPAPSCSSLTDYGDANGIALDASGNLYLALGQAPGGDPSASGIVIQKRTPAGRLIATWTTPGAHTGKALHPAGIALDARGDIYVSDANAGHIVKLSPSGRVLATWGTVGTASGQFDQPAGLAVDRRGDLYVADKGNGRIQVFNGAGRLHAAWPLPPASKQQPSRPAGIAVDARGRMYVADEAIRILVLSPAGVVLRAWGSKGDAPTQFRHPVALALDPHGRLDIADKLNARIQQFAATGKPITRWATGAKAGWFGAQGSAPTQPAFPTGVAVTTGGTLYVLAGWCSSRVQAFTATGRSLAIWPVTG